jgi:hypothetical protein
MSQPSASHCVWRVALQQSTPGRPIASASAGETPRCFPNAPGPAWLRSSLENMPTITTKIFLDEPRPRGAVFRYGFLAFLFALGIFAAVTAAHLAPTARGRYFGFIVPPTLLLVHLASQFWWPRPVKVGLRVAVIMSCCVMVVYTLSVAFAK